MRIRRVGFCRAFLASILAIFFALPPSLFAESHLVNPAELQQELLKASRIRMENQQAIQQLLSSDVGQKALRSVHVDQVQVTQAIARLDNSELARLAERARRGQQDFVAGSLSKESLLIIAVAIIVVIIIVAVKV
jgi:hypothetical protein